MGYRAKFVCFLSNGTSVRLKNWNTGLLASCLSRSLKVIGTDTDRSGAYDFLLTFHSNHWPISHRFQGIARYRPKIANFPTQPLFNAPQMDKKTRTMGYQEAKKSL